MRRTETSGTSFEEGLPRSLGTLSGALGCVLSGYFLMAVIKESEQINKNEMQEICAAFIASLILQMGVGTAAAVSGNCAARSFLGLFPRARKIRTQFLLPSIKSSLEIAAAVGFATASCVAFTAARM